MVFSRDGWYQEGIGGGELHVSKEIGWYLEGGMKKESGAWYTFPHYLDALANQLFQLQDLSKTFTNDSLHKLLSR